MSCSFHLSVINDEITQDFERVCRQRISFEVRKGAIFAFLGPHGASKTTTIKMLTTLPRPTGGSVELDGLDPQREQNEARRRFGNQLGRTDSK